ncbi:MAG: MFS transporter [Victivallales bacterium]|nr:MFS transporter [Victivallales bacterium]
MDTDKRKKLFGWLLLLFISIIYYFSNLQKVLVPGATFNELQQAFNIDATQVTRLGAAFLYVYAFMQLATGLLADRFSGARVIVVGGVIFCAGSLLSAYDKSFSLLFVSRMLTGFGAATIYLSAVKEIGRIVPNSLPVFIGLLTIIGYSGAITGTSPFIAGVHKFGYTPMMLAAGIGLAVSFLLYLAVLFFCTMPPIRKDVTFHPKAYMDVLKISHNRNQIVAIGICFGTYFAMQSVIGKKFLEDFCGMSSANASNVLLVTMIIAAVNSFIVAYLSKWCGERRLPFLRFGGIGSLVSSVVLLTAVVLNIRAPWMAVSAMILMAFAGNISSMNVAAFKEVNDEKCFGTVMSVSNFAAYLVTAVFGGCIGKLMDIFPPQVIDGVKIYGQNSYLLIFSVLMVLCVIATITTMMLKETHIPKKESK